MATLKQIWMDKSKLYHAYIEVNGKEIEMIQIRPPIKFRIESYEPVYDFPKQSVTENGK